MKKVAKIILLIALIFIYPGEIRAESSAPSLMLDGIPLVLWPEPFWQDSELMVPLPEIAEAMGVKTSWDTKKISFCGVRQQNCFIVRLSSRQAVVNRQPINMPAEFQLIQGHYYVPLSFLTYALGARIDKSGSVTAIQDRTDGNKAPAFLLSGMPELKFLNKLEARPGEYICLYLSNIGLGDIVTLRTNLVHHADFYRSGGGRLLLLPISCSQKPGLYYLKISAQREGHTYLIAQPTVRVKSRWFPSQHLKVSSQLLAKRSASMWALDKPFWDKGLAVSDDNPLWTGTFIHPAPGKISTQFGAIRTVNKGKPSRHSGLDVSLPTKTPVKAVQAGVVTLAMPLHVTGNTVFIDHGCGLFSIYYHLNSISVKRGQKIQPGDLVGRVGSTGFSTGPHLHWSMRLNDVYVDPAFFIVPNTTPITIPIN